MRGGGVQTKGFSAFGLLCPDLCRLWGVQTEDSSIPICAPSSLLGSPVSPDIFWICRAALPDRVATLKVRKGALDALNKGSGALGEWSKGVAPSGATPEELYEFVLPLDVILSRLSQCNFSQSNCSSDLTSNRWGAPKQLPFQQTDGMNPRHPKRVGKQQGDGQTSIDEGKLCRPKNIPRKNLEDSAYVFLLCFLPPPPPQKKTQERSTSRTDPWPPTHRFVLSCSAINCFFGGFSRVMHLLAVPSSRPIRRTYNEICEGLWDTTRNFHES